MESDFAPKVWGSNIFLKNSCNLYFFRFIRYHDIVCSDANSPRNGVPRAIFDAKKSFPSGHALLSTYAAIFMVVSAQYILKFRFSKKATETWQNIPVDLSFMSSSSHIGSEWQLTNLTIGVEYRNCQLLWMFIYFLLFGWGKFYQNWFTYL